MNKHVVLKAPGFRFIRHRNGRLLPARHTLKLGVLMLDTVHPEVLSGSPGGN
jgi:hypothetical protein